MSGLTRDEMAHEMRQAVLDLLDEICKADGFDTKARDAGRRALDKAMSVILAPDAPGVNWVFLDGLTAEEIRMATRVALRDDVLRALAPARPS